MELQFSRRLRIIGIAVLMLLAWADPSHAQTWQPLLNQPCLFSNPCFGTGTALLLTDGSVMVQDNNEFQWLRLAPDANGSYVNGTWSQLASRSGPLSCLSRVHLCCFWPDWVAWRFCSENHAELDGASDYSDGP